MDEPEELIEIALWGIPEELHEEFLRLTLALDLDFAPAPVGAEAARAAAMPPLQVVLTMPLPAPGVRDTRAPGVRLGWRADDGPPLDFGGGRPHGHLREIFEDERDADRMLWRELGHMGGLLSDAWEHPRVKQRRQATGHVTFTNAHLKPVFRNIPLDLTDPTRVVRRSVADEVRGAVGVGWMRAKLDEGLPGGLEMYTDPNTLHMLETGYRYPGHPAHTVTMVPPLGSALPFLAPIAAQMEGELVPPDGTPAKYDGHLWPQAWPSRYHSLGGVVKDGKIRPITDAGSPHDVYIDELCVAMNAAAKVADPNAYDEEDVRWVQTRTFLEQAEVIHSIYTVLGTVPEFMVDADVLRHLAPVSFCSDCRAFYRQFPVCKEHEKMSGVVLPRYDPTTLKQRPPDERSRGGLQLLDTEYLVFGPSGAPGFATDVAHLMTTLQRIDNWWWEDAVRAAAEGGCPWCTLLWPEPLRRLMELRRETVERAAGRPEVEAPGMRRRQDDLMPSEQYIDDRKGDMLGVVRGLHAMWTCWYHARPECTNLPVSIEKAQYGVRVEHLGIEWHARAGTVATKPGRVTKLNVRLDRMRTVKTVEHDELESLLGSLGFVGQVIDGVRTVLGRSFRAVHNPKIWKANARTGGDAISARVWLRTDLTLVQRLLNEHTASAYVTIPWAFDLACSWQAPTDACRCTSGRTYSGLGGFVTFPGYIKYWHLELPFDMVSPEDGIPVHITERLCANITINVMPELQHGALIQLIDNQAAVACLDRKSAKDLRMQELNLLTAQQLEMRNLKTETRWISTDENLWADLISRGKIHGAGGFVELAMAAGAQKMVEIPLSVMPGTAPVGAVDLRPLLERLQAMSRHLRAAAKDRAQHV